MGLPGFSFKQYDARQHAKMPREDLILNKPLSVQRTALIVADTGTPVSFCLVVPVKQRPASLN